jgi:uncharacterized protein
MPTPEESLKARLRADLTAAMKARDELRTATIRMVLTAVATEEVAGKQARELSDEEVLAVLGREAKKRREAAEAFDAGGRTDSADRERAEGAVLATYLPAQLDDSEIVAVVAAAIANTNGPVSKAAFGTVMKAVTPHTRGRADGSRVANEVRRQLDGER